MCSQIVQHLMLKSSLIPSWRKPYKQMSSVSLLQTRFQMMTATHHTSLLEMMPSVLGCGWWSPMGGMACQLLRDYRLSRARQIVENAFGILANRFGCLLTTLKQQPPMLIDVILSCICLHNLMCICFPALHNVALDAEDDQLNLIPGAQMQDVLNIVGGNRATWAAKQQREYLKLHYNSPTGAVPCQLDWI